MNEANAIITELAVRITYRRVYVDSRVTESIHKVKKKPPGDIKFEAIIIKILDSNNDPNMKKSHILIKLKILRVI